MSEQPTKATSIDRYLSKLSQKLRGIFPNKKWSDRLDWVAANADRIEDGASVEKLLRELRGIANNVDAYAAQIDMKLPGDKK